MAEIKFDKKNEIWKSIKNYEADYEVSNLGNVRSIDRYKFCKSKTIPNLFKGKILSQREDKNGYKIVNLKKAGKSHLKKVHRLVAIAFLYEDNYNLQINHIDGNKRNNDVNNLEWCSARENAQHRTKNLLSKPKLNKSQIIDIKSNCKPAKNQVNRNTSISFFAKKYNVDRRTISDIINNKKLYLGAICK